MSPVRWFLFLAGAGVVTGLILLVAEARPLGGTISIGEGATVRR